MRVPQVSISRPGYRDATRTNSFGQRPNDGKSRSFAPLTPQMMTHLRSPKRAPLRMTPFGIAKNLKLTTLDALAHRDVIPEPLQLLAVGAALGLFGGEGFLGRHALAA